MFRIREPIQGVPIVVFHIGDQAYLHAAIRHNRQFGQVVLFGDESNMTAPNCLHVNYKRFVTPELQEFMNHFVNYSTNPHFNELLCFRRLFYIRRWMEITGIRECVHVDSDCLLYRPLSELFPDKKVAYSYRSGSDVMAASIHVSFLTYDFLLAYEKICRNIYVTKTRFNLIEDKIRFHKDTGAPGGICDMTIYYLLTKEFPVRALMDLQPDGSTFDDNISDNNGFLGAETWERLGGMKIIRNQGGVIEAKCIDGRWIRLNNLHFQGSAKKYIR